MESEMIDKETRYDMIKQANQKVLKGQRFRALMKQKAKEQRGYEERGRKSKSEYIGEYDYVCQSIIKNNNLPELDSIKETYNNTVKFDNIWS
jgi:hypothetical protein